MIRALDAADTRELTIRQALARRLACLCLGLTAGAALSLMRLAL